MLMPHIPPINRRELGKSGLLKEDRFYQLLAARCNYVDDKIVKSFYLALVKLVVSELRANKVIRLPHLGDFALVEQKPKTALVGKFRKFIGAIRIVKFYPKDALRQYFSKLDETRTML